jgi:eukaryotic-like serine/threonine-protein kinase
VALLNAGQLDGALAEFQRALAIREKVFGATHPTVGEDLKGIATVELERKRFAAAEIPAARALAILEPAGSPPETLANARWLLARALWGQGVDRERARALARAARDGYASAPGWDKEAGEVAAWLAHPH